MLGLILWFNLALGLQDSSALINNEYRYDNPPIYAEIELHAENEWLDLYGIYKNEMKKWDSVYFYPELDSYTIGANIDLGFMDFTVEHQCVHPVAPFGRIEQTLDSSYNKIEVSFSSKDNK